MPRAPRLPKTFRFPGFEPIHVKYVSARKIKKACGEVCFGAWIPPIIYINSDEPNWEQLRTLYHELKHALVDAEHMVRLRIVEPLQLEAGQTIADLMDED